MPRAGVAPRARSTACGVAVALVLGLALIATGVALTARDGAGATMDGARALRQARWTPQQREAAGSAGGSGTPTAAQAAVPASIIAAAAPITTLPPDVGGKGACLITKWSAVWLVHPDGKTRSHVTTPTAECDLHASTVEDMDKYIKAHGGNGAYSLSEGQSAAACRYPGCFPNEASSAPGAGSGALAAPVNGWGMGVSKGWQERANLRFNEPAKAGFVASPPPPGEPLLLVFGGASVTDMLRNWALHARELGMGYTVACMDQQLFETANARQIPAAIMADTSTSGAVSTRWKYYRMDPKAFMQMGILKV